MREHLDHRFPVEIRGNHAPVHTQKQNAKQKIPQYLSHSIMLLIDFESEYLKRRKTANCLE